MPTKSLWASLFIVFFVTTMHSAQAQRSMTSAVERLFNKIESDILSSAEAMPESRYNFTHRISKCLAASSKASALLPAR